MKIWKRNAVISSIVLFVCVALYLSWAYGRDNDPNGTKVFDPNPEVSIQVDNLSEENPEEVLTETDDNIDVVTSDYFAEARLTRSQARDSALTILSSAANNEENSGDIVSGAISEIEKLAQSAMSEASIESLVKAKGFVDCVAIISADGVKVIVSEPIGGLTDTDVAKIKDIVLSESVATINDIKIIGKGA